MHCKAEHSIVLFREAMRSIAKQSSARPCIVMYRIAERSNVLQSKAKYY